MKNKNLHNAKTAKNDEFYTQIEDIQNELFNYKEYFKNKTIFCNCDDPEESNFWKYFSLNFEFFGLKKLVATHFEKDKPSYKLEIVKDVNNDGVVNRFDTIKTELKQNGDFRSPECIDILKEADIVVTNPPFSLFREFVAQLIEYNKKFIIIGNQNAITYKEIFKLIKDNKIWLGCNKPTDFRIPYQPTQKNAIKLDNGQSIIKMGSVVWFTNLKHKKRNEELILYREYNPIDYPKYDNYDAINVDKVKDIPKDYFKVIGVPITFLDKYNPEQFEIVDLGIVGSINFSCNKKMEILDKNGNSTGKITRNAKGTLYRKYNPKIDKSPAFKDCETGDLYSSIYARIIIKNKKI